jgi:serine/threonine protein phosphatase PrpC
MNIGYHTDQNVRDKNQDYYCFFNTPSVSVMAVLDGHGSDGHHASKHFGSIIADHKRWNKPTKDVIDEICKIQWNPVTFDMDGSGTTMVALVKRPNSMEVVNIGDSRLVMYVKENNQWKILLQTKDHKFTNPKEELRALQAGNMVIRGYAISDDRSSGLNVSRTLGDLRYKNGVINAVSTEPDLTYINLSNGTRVSIVMGSDGLWDVMQPENLTKYLDQKPAKRAKQLVDDAILTGKTRDNITVITTDFVF